MNNKTSHSGISTTTTCSSSNLCYDSLIKQCVRCNILTRYPEKTTAILRAVSPTHQEITPPAAAQKCPALILGVLAGAGLVLAMAAVLWFVIQKQKRRIKKRKADEEGDPKEMENGSISFENQVHKETKLSGEDSSVLVRCPSNGASNRIILRDDNSKTAGSDVTEATSLSSCDEKGNHTFPLPATELGATVLVTTKTTQENFIKAELA